MQRPWYLKTGAELEEDARGDDPRALLRLADAISLGHRGLAVDASRVFALEERAAELGSGRAARRIADHLSIGHDEREARRWYRRAAELGDFDAMAESYPLCRSADPMEAADARRWLASAAHAGHWNAVEILHDWCDDDAVEPELRQLAAATLAAIGSPPRSEWAAATPVAFELEADAGAINDLVGGFVERIDRRWPDLACHADLGDCIDFPGPRASPLEEGWVLELTMTSDVRRLDLIISLRAGVWTIDVITYAPHPTQGALALLLADLHASASERALTLRPVREL